MSNVKKSAVQLHKCGEGCEGGFYPFSQGTPPLCGVTL